MSSASLIVAILIIIAVILFAVFIVVGFMLIVIFLLFVLLVVQVGGKERPQFRNVVRLSANDSTGITLLWTD